MGYDDGQASSNVELKERRGNVTSVYPVYNFSADQIGQRTDEIYEDIVVQTLENQDKFWQEIGSVEELGKIKISTMAKFIKDFPEGIMQKIINIV